MVKKTLVLGVSSNPERYSYKALNKLIEKKIDVKAIGNSLDFVREVKIHKLKIPFKNIHTVTIYLNKIRQREYYDYIISLNPQRVIFNPGTENPDFYLYLKNKFINYTEACTLVLLSTNQY
jgi:predicted CoA-binding protein